MLDILEILAGEAKATKMAKSFGMNALEPFDKNDGKDLQTPRPRNLWSMPFRGSGPISCWSASHARSTAS